MKVGILGSGEVAKTLAGGFLKYGHDVMLGTRDVAKLRRVSWSMLSSSVRYVRMRSEGSVWPVADK
jgi:predicted dinucleotide-binding enzyme